MKGKIFHITNHKNSIHESGTFEQFRKWLFSQRYVQFDIETTVSEWWNEYKIISMQFGSCTSDRVQWFLQYSELSEEQIGIIREYLQNQLTVKLIHNAAFEYIVCRFHGIIIENVYDTMLVEKILLGGIENENYALADISWKYLRIVMDKSLQMSFGDNTITDAKIEYGITDVAYLDVIRSLQIADAQVKNLINVVALENEAVLAFSDITYNGMKLDIEKWRENERLARPLVQSAKETLDKWLTCEPFHTFAKKVGYISDTDRSTINYNSHIQKGELLALLYPGILGGSAGVVKAYLRDNATAIPLDYFDALQRSLSKDFTGINTLLIMHHRDYLVEHGYLLPAGISTINWNSTDQVLPLAQLVEPRLKDLSEESRNKCTHPILKDLEKYKQALKLINDLGESYITKHVGPDGYVRTNFNQIVSTGRCSSSRPNMQNITVDELVGTRYRNAFVCDSDEEFVDSDYVSQELVIIAYISKDPVWMEAIANGWDLHSIAAELVYKSKWKAAAESSCEYYKNKQKCSCKRHKIMRNGCKSINFGLAYGMTEIKLAGELGISVKEAMALIKEYFSAFPSIRATLEFLGNFGLQNGYIMTLAPFFRKRWFPYWSQWRNYIEPHMMGVKYVPTLGEIERASKNAPIQGSSADITKCAMVLIRNHIRDNNLWDMIKLRAQVHDQVTTTSKKTMSKEWRSTMDQLMVEAAKIVIPTGILKAETNITPYWTK